MNQTPETLKAQGATLTEDHSVTDAGVRKTRVVGREGEALVEEHLLADARRQAQHEADGAGHQHHQVLALKQISLFLSSRFQRKLLASSLW